MATQTQHQAQTSYYGNDDPSAVERILDMADAPAVSPMGEIVAAQVDIQVSTAKRWPRNPRVCRDRAMEIATLDKGTAGGCVYSVPRAGGNIVGPSIRLAEIMLQTYSNMRAEAHILEVGKTQVRVQAHVWDLENNTACTVEATRGIMGSPKWKNGKQIPPKRFGEDMIRTTTMAAISIALRNAVFRMIPKTVWGPVFDAARKVFAGDIKSIGERRAKMWATLAPLGVTREMVLEHMEKSKLEDITSDDIEYIGGLYNAIVDEGAEPAEVFAPKPTEDDSSGSGRSRAATVTDTLKAKRDAKQNGGASKCEAVPAGVDPATGEVIDAPPGTTARGTDTSAIKDDEPRDWVMGGRKRGIANHPSKDDIEKLAGLLAKAGRSVEDTCRAMGLEHLAQIDNVDWAASMESLERDLQDKPDTDAP